MDFEKHLRNKITLITFLCCFGVLFFHTYNVTTYGINEDSIGFSKFVYCVEKYSRNIASISTSIFFVISGFLFFRNYKPNQWLSKYKKRFFTIVIPYLCWCSIYFLYLVILSSFAMTKNLLPDYELTHLSFMNWINSLWINEYYVLWFLKYLIIYIALSPIMFFLLNNKKRIGVGSASIILMLILYEYNHISDSFVCYFFGSYLAINYSRYIYYKNNTLSYISILYVILFLSIRMVNQEITMGLPLLVFCLAIWFSLDKFNLSIEFPWWMYITFFIYVAHDLPLEAFEKIIYLVFGNNAIVALLDYIFMPFLIYLLLSFIYKNLKRYTPRFLKVLTGNR